MRPRWIEDNRGAGELSRSRNDLLVVLATEGASGWVWKATVRSCHTSAGQPNLQVQEDGAFRQS